ncbi:MAG TPA: MBL fold metallo-hydrolase, partial [Gammaproteobacteria bacterium]
MSRTAAPALAGAILLLGPLPARPQTDFSAVEIEPYHVSGNVYMLVGAGGNMAVSVGDDGVLLVDDQFAPLTEKIVAAIRTLSDEPIKYVINTHLHGD